MKLFGNRGSHEGKPQHAQTRTEPARSVTERPDPEQVAEELAEIQKKKRLRRIFIAGGAVVLAVLAVVVGYAIWEKPPDVRHTQPPAGETAAPGVTLTPGKPTDTKDPQSTDDPENTDAPGDEEDYTDAPLISMTSDRKDGVYTVLLIGLDKVSSNTDTIMVVSFDTKNHTISGTSIPRDTLVNIPWTSPKKINSIYPGSGGGERGAKALETQVGNLLGFEVDNYVVVYLQAVEDAVNAIGGVWFDVPQDMIYSAPDQDLYIDIRAGYQLLDGENALKLCRFRSGYAGGDLERIGVQHDFLMAMANQMLSLGNITNLSSLIDVVVDDVDTDLSAANIAWFARQFLKCGKDDITFQTAPLGSGDLINGISYVGLAVNSWLQMVNESINPYVDDVTVNNVNILTFNYGGQYVGATNGMIAGGWDSFYCMECTAAAGGSTWIHHGPNTGHIVDTAGTGNAAAGAGEEVPIITAPGNDDPGGTGQEPPPEEYGQEESPGQPEEPKSGGPEIITVTPGEADAGGTE